jgi:hypothetical protein
VNQPQLDYLTYDFILLCANIIEFLLQGVVHSHGCMLISYIFNMYKCYKHPSVEWCVHFMWHSQLLLIVTSCSHSGAVGHTELYQALLTWPLCLPACALLSCPIHSWCRDSHRVCNLTGNLTFIGVAH